MYNSAPYLPEFCERVVNAAEKSGFSEFEIILVDDGSPDDSLKVALEMREGDPRIKIVELARNFGHHKALMCAISYCTGDLVFLIDVDLEEPPELLTEFHGTMAEEDLDVVYGVQTGRKGGFFEKLSGALFFKAFNSLAGIRLPNNLSTARLMKRRYVDELLKHREREICIAGLWQITGFHQKGHPFTKGSKGVSSYSFLHKIRLLVNVITSFSNQPLVWIFYLGTLISGLAGLAGLFLVGKVLFLGGFLEGWASLMVSVWLLGGLTIFSIGVVGIYLSKIFSEAKRRPNLVIRETHGLSIDNPKAMDYATG